MTKIEHLILCGGGPVGLVQYGALKYLTYNNYLSLSNIKSIYATSIGCIISFIYMINLEWSWMDDFLIKRPWEKLVNFTPYDYLNMFYTKGLLNLDFVTNCLKPLFLAKDIELTITLKEFYELTNIEFNLYTCNFTKFQKEQLNYISYPDLSLIEAIYMSLTIPILCVPFYKNNCFYFDGGILVVCPLNECIIDKKCDLSTILCFTNDKTQPIDLSNNFHNKCIQDVSGTATSLDTIVSNSGDLLSNNSNLFELIIFIIKILFHKISTLENSDVTIENSINVALTEQMVNVSYWKHAFTSESERSYLINLGTLQAEKYISKNSNTS
jgi:predicted acylesterase/phospholipase RssA